MSRRQVLFGGKATSSKLAVWGVVRAPMLPSSPLRYDLSLRDPKKLTSRVHRSQTKVAHRRGSANNLKPGGRLLHALIFQADKEEVVSPAQGVSLAA